MSETFPSNSAMAMANPLKLRIEGGPVVDAVPSQHAPALGTCATIGIAKANAVFAMTEPRHGR